METLFFIITETQNIRWYSNDALGGGPTSRNRIKLKVKCYTALV